MRMSDIDWDKEWEKGKATLRLACVDIARRRETQIAAHFFPLLHEGHRDHAHFYQMMREVDDAEFAAGRNHLGAVIVSRSSPTPGDAFLQFLAKRRACGDDLVACWEEERNLLFDYWSSHPDGA
jgi:hypothetical protein